jgi:hypothetical protein
LNGTQASGPQRIAALLDTLGNRGWHDISLFVTCDKKGCSAQVC